MSYRTFLFSITLIALLSCFSDGLSVVWIGSVTSNSFLIHTDIEKDVTSIVISRDEKFSTIFASRRTNTTISIIQPQSVYDRLRKFRFGDLKPRTKYYIAEVRNGRFSSIGSVRTFPEDGDQTDITFAFASCQISSGRDRSFREIREWLDEEEKKRNPKPFFFLHTGDLHYSDIETDSLVPYEKATRKVLKEKHVRRVFSSMPVPYMYDDHDYGANNAGFSSKSRKSALKSYRNMVPNYPLPSTEASYHAFTIGAVRFIMSDTRAMSRKEKGSTLGTRQREWLYREFENADKYKVVVWMTSKPWIGPEIEGEDSWSGFGEERRNISRKLAELEVNNLVAIAGDAHMLAADDGQNTDYTGSGKFNPAGFPIFQAAPLSHYGSSKGGPYSQGCFAYRAILNHHYGVLKLSKLKDRSGPCVEFSGIVVGSKENPRITFRKCGQLSGVRGSGGQATSCSLQTFPTWVAVLLVGGILFILILFIVGIVAISRCIRKKRGKRNQTSPVPTNSTEVSASES